MKTCLHTIEYSCCIFKILSYVFKKRCIDLFLSHDSTINKCSLNYVVQSLIVCVPIFLTISAVSLLKSMLLIKL